MYKISLNINIYFCLTLHPPELQYRHYNLRGYVKENKVSSMNTRYFAVRNVTMRLGIKAGTSQKNIPFRHHI